MLNNGLLYKQAMLNYGLLYKQAILNGGVLLNQQTVVVSEKKVAWNVILQ